MVTARYNRLYNRCSLLWYIDTFCRKKDGKYLFLQRQWLTGCIWARPSGSAWLPWWGCTSAGQPVAARRWTSVPGWSVPRPRRYNSAGVSSPFLRFSEGDPSLHWEVYATPHPDQRGMTCSQHLRHEILPNGSLLFFQIQMEKLESQRAKLWYLMHYLERSCSCMVTGLFEDLRLLLFLLAGIWLPDIHCVVCISITP